MGKLKRSQKLKLSHQRIRNMTLQLVRGGNAAAYTAAAGCSAAGCYTSLTSGTDSTTATFHATDAC
jgi:hypothetical protein